MADKHTDGQKYFISRGLRLSVTSPFTFTVNYVVQSYSITIKFYNFSKSRLHLNVDLNCFDKSTDFPKYLFVKISIVVMTHSVTININYETLFEQALKLSLVLVLANICYECNNEFSQ